MILHKQPFLNLVPSLAIVFGIRVLAYVTFGIFLSEIAAPILELGKPTSAQVLVIFVSIELIIALLRILSGQPHTEIKMTPVFREGEIVLVPKMPDEVEQRRREFLIACVENLAYITLIVIVMAGVVRIWF